MKKERLQTEPDRGSQSHDHDASIGFVIAEYPLPAKFSPPVNRATEKSKAVELYTEAMKRQADQQRRKQVDYSKKFSHRTKSVGAIGSSFSTTRSARLIGLHSSM